MNRLKTFISKYKNESWFRPAVAILILLVMAIAAQLYSDSRDNIENSNTENSSYSETAEESEETVSDKIFSYFWNNCKAHVIVLLGLTAALGAAHRKQHQELKESE